MTARSLSEIAADALLADCGHCWPGSGNPCSCDRPDAMHLARFARARRRGILSDQDMCAVLDASGDVFEPSTVISVESGVAA